MFKAGGTFLMRTEPEFEQPETGVWKALGIGFALAVVVLLVPFLEFVFGYLGVLVHESGHAVVAWLFGYPAVPAFDFQYGGGVTVHEDRKILIVILVYAALACGFYRFRANRRSLAALAVLTAAYSLAAWTPLHEVLHLFMGHGFELIFAGIFLYRAVSGEKIKVRAERPLYAFAGFFLLLCGIRFAWRLIYSPEHRMMYEQAKGGGHWMDFSRIAEEYLHTDLAPVAGFFMLCCILPPIVVLLVYRNRDSIRSFLEGILRTEG
jgi:hypothetical protein